MLKFRHDSDVCNSPNEDLPYSNHLHAKIMTFSKLLPNTNWRKILSHLQFAYIWINLYYPSTSLASSISIISAIFQQSRTGNFSMVYIATHIYKSLGQQNSNHSWLIFLLQLLAFLFSWRHAATYSDTIWEGQRENGLLFPISLWVFIHSYDKWKHHDKKSYLESRWVVMGVERRNVLERSTGISISALWGCSCFIYSYNVMLASCHEFLEEAAKTIHHIP